MSHPSADDDLTGRTLAGRYRVVRPLGAGGMGQVYVAVQERLGREVALKVLKGGLGQDPQGRERFQREARALAQLSHAGVVSVFDFDVDDDGRCFLAMELVAGDTLRQRLRARGRMPWAASIPIVRAIAAALAAAHRVGVIHRDLKPENVMMTEPPSSSVKLLDFGVAKLAGVGETNLTGTGNIIGTPGYIAPEVVMEGITDDARSDLCG